MTPPSQDLERRRPVWEVLSWFFLDSEMDDGDRRRMADTIAASGYTPDEIQHILWEELYPVLRTNLYGGAGVWEGFDLDWMQEQILSGTHRRTLVMRMMGVLPFGPALIIRQEWQQLLPLMPEPFQHENARA